MGHCGARSRANSNVPAKWYQSRTDNQCTSIARWINGIPNNNNNIQLSCLINTNYLLLELILDNIAHILYSITFNDDDK